MSAPRKFHISFRRACGVNRISSLLRVAGIVALACFAAAPAHAQISSVDTSKPIVVKNPKVVKEVNEKFSGEVVSANTQVLIVRGEQNPMAIRTFSYAPALQNKPAYGYGQKVEVEYKPGTDIALRIKAKAKRTQ